MKHPKTAVECARDFNLAMKNLWNEIVKAFRIEKAVRFLNKWAKRVQR